MERLEPVLKQKFWILMGIGILMTVIGWWMATGTMAATITTRQTEIKGAEDKVKGVSSGDIPNNEWSAGLAAINAKQDSAVKSASLILWERQQARMSWPETVDEFAKKSGYRKEIDVAGRENYRTDYDNDWRRVWEAVRPFNRIDGSGIVDFGLSKLPRRQAGTLAPSSDEMWDAQEDLWLLEGILQSIAELNGGENSTRMDAVVHVIERLTLHGGQPAGQRTSGAAATGGGSGTPEMPPSGFGGGYGSGSGSGGGNAPAVSADFDVKEEFGDDGGGAAGGGSAGYAAMPGSGSGATGPVLKRYIDDDKALPFRTRGFYMTLIMDHRKIPNLIAELSANEKSAWPIEIVRVQYVRLHEDDIDGRGAGSSFSPTMSGSDFSSQPGGGSGYPGSSSSGESSFGPAAAPSFSTEVGAAGASQQSQVAIAALMNAVQDPNMARVAICGIITLYNEVKPADVGVPPATNPPATPETSAPAAQPQQSTTETPKTSETGAAPEEKPVVPGEEKPGESTPPTPDESSPKQPAADTKKDETPSTSPNAKPTGTP